MSTDQMVHMVWLVLAIILVGSGLAARRLSWGKSAALIAIWVGIIGALWAVVTAFQTLG